ncbi:MAG: 3-oxo-tetronate kinase [Caulobacteraceae bacterium]
MILGCIGDDYTGSSDLANALTRAGLRTVQTIGVPADDLDLAGIDAVVVALKSRSIAPDDAVAMALPAHAWLKARGAQHVLFKVCSTFDSTDRGNIGPVMDALIAAEGDPPLVLVNSAFPENKRSIYLGNLFVGDVPLNESSMKDHPLNPMHDANLVRVLGRQSRTRIGLVSLSTVDQGEGAIEARMAALKAEGYGAAIIDLVLDRDLGPMGRAALKMPLSVGASGMGIGLARALIEQGAVTPASAGAWDGSSVGGKAACLSGSCSAATLAQVAEAERVMPVMRLDAAALVTGPEEADRALAWALPKLDAGPVLIASTAPPEEVQALQARFGRDRAGHVIEQAMARIAQGLVQGGVRRLIVAGGETSGAAVDRLGLKAFAIGPEIAPGVPVLRTVGAGPAMILALKSGNFGGPGFFADALQLMS